MKTVPDSSAEGNTPIPSASKLSKQVPPRKNHFFTFNYEKVPDFSFDNIVLELKKFAYKGKVQSEVAPTTGTKHLQGMIWCKNKHRDTEFKLLKGAHFEPLKDYDNVANYCNKDESHDGLFRSSWGFTEIYKELIPENVMYDWEKDIIELLNSEPDKRSLHWFWEPDGCKGKTTFQKYLFTHYEECVVLSGKGADMKNGIVEYLNTNKKLPKIVLVNIPKSSLGFVSYTGLEEIKDMFFFSGKYEGGMVCGACPHMLIFANEEPNYKKMSLDRFIVKQIGAITP